MFTTFLSEDGLAFKKQEECEAYEAALKELKEAEKEYKTSLKAFKEKYNCTSALSSSDYREKLWMFLL
jgi:hypothetical protein